MIAHLRLRHPSIEFLKIIKQVGKADHHAIAASLGVPKTRAAQLANYLVKTGKLECIKRPDRGKAGSPGIYQLSGNSGALVALKEEK